MHTITTDTGRVARLHAQLRRERAASRAYHALLEAGAELTWRARWDTGREHGPITRGEHEARTGSSSRPTGSSSWLRPWTR